jgi:hypothetical protein
MKRHRKAVETTRFDYVQTSAPDHCLVVLGALVLLRHNVIAGHNDDLDV